MLIVVITISKVILVEIMMVMIMMTMMMMMMTMMMKTRPAILFNISTLLLHLPAKLFLFIIAHLSFYWPGQVYHQYEYDDDDVDDDYFGDDDEGVPFNSGALVPCDKPTLLLYHPASHRTANLNHFYTIF